MASRLPSISDHICQKWLWKSGGHRQIERASPRLGVKAPIACFTACPVPSCFLLYPDDTAHLCSHRSLHIGTLMANDHGMESATAGAVCNT